MSRAFLCVVAAALRTALVAALGVSSASSACAGGSCPAQADSVLLQRKRVVESVRVDGGVTLASCPVSGEKCVKNKCCSGISFTLGKTFPCPTSDVGYAGCEVNGEDGIVDGLLRAMTQKEKFNMLRGTGFDKWDSLPGYFVGNTGLKEKHGIPSLNMQDNGNGFRTLTREIVDEVTAWPCSLAVASSWSEADTERWGAALGEEFRSKGANVILGPGVNVHRVAKGGRNAEYVSGESPYLGARLVQPWVRGVQSKRVMAVVKHFVLNSQETNRSSVNSTVDDRTLWEVYYPPFEAAVKAGVGAVMCSYNYVNGLQACNNPQTLTEDLKGAMGFEGFVQSDWWALHEFAALAGVDQEMPGNPVPGAEAYFSDKNLRTLSGSRVDDMVRRQLVMMYRIGLYDDPVCQPPACFGALYNATATTPAHQSLNQELAMKAVVLLKNAKGVLPLSASSSPKIVLLGKACDAGQDIERQLHWWMASSYYNIGGSGRVIPANVTTIYGGVRARCRELGCDAKLYGGNSTEEALAFVEAAAPSVVLLCGGANTTEARDRDTLSVDDEAFLTEVAKGVQGLPVVSLTMSPGVILMPWIDDVDAALNIFTAGTYTGDALADALFGRSNPSAKLPVTFPKSEADTVDPCIELTCPYTEKLMVGFHGLEGKPVAFPFGHGLSYSSFEYSALSVVIPREGGKLPQECEGAAVCVRATVANKGVMAGVEVAQMYLGFPKSAGEPPKLLRGFVRMGVLKPGGSEEVVMPLYDRDLQIYSGRATGWTTVDGTYQVYVGASSRDIRLTGSLTACKGAWSSKVGACA